MAKGVDWTGWHGPYERCEVAACKWCRPVDTTPPGACERCEKAEAALEEIINLKVGTIHKSEAFALQAAENVLRRAIGKP